MNVAQDVSAAALCWARAPVQPTGVGDRKATSSGRDLLLSVQRYWFDPAPVQCAHESTSWRVALASSTFRMRDRRGLCLRSQVPRCRVALRRSDYASIRDRQIRRLVRECTAVFGAREHASTAAHPHRRLHLFARCRARPNGPSAQLRGPPVEVVYRVAWMPDAWSRCGRSPQNGGQLNEAQDMSAAALCWAACVLDRLRKMVDAVVWGVELRVDSEGRPRFEDLRVG